MISGELISLDRLRAAHRYEVQRAFGRSDYELVENIRGENVPRGRYDPKGKLHEVIDLSDYMEYEPSQGELEDENAWTGKISLDNISERYQKRAREILDNPGILDPYYVICSKYAPSRCIDGRCDSCFVQGEHRWLGAQNPGGTAMAALCERISSPRPIYHKMRALQKDIGKAQKKLDAFDMAIGGHIDDHSPEDMTGCGAIDNLPEILAKITNPSFQFQVRKMASVLLGGDYDSDMVDGIVGRLVALQGMSGRYLEYNPQNNTYGYRHQAIEAIRKASPEGVSKLTGKHREIALVVNMVKDTTFDTDQFNADNDSELQLFNYDFWRSKNIAQAFYPGTRDELGEVEFHKIQKQRKRYITTRAMFAIATCMTLTDGTPELIIRHGLSRNHSKITQTMAGTAAKAA